MYPLFFFFFTFVLLLVYFDKTKNINSHHVDAVRKILLQSATA